MIDDAGYAALLEQPREQLAEMLLLAAHVLTEAMETPRVCEALYVMAHVPATEDPLLRGAVALWERLARAPKILVCADGPASGFAGGAAWRRTLRDAMGVPSSAVVLVGGAQYQGADGKPALNSATEAPPVVRWCRENGVAHLTVVAHHFHVLRSYLGFVTAAREVPGLHVSPYAVAALPRDARHTHSQGTLTSTLPELVESEIAKCFAYRNLVRPGEARAITMARYAECAERRAERGAEERAERGAEERAERGAEERGARR
ncbi:hypothetical protein [Sorangium sp. So ce341]|uniref:hypothetical protein n=1 Tax=Sorangium sp. So ce341 TaxID=3133302 RepID=UPI003F5FF9AF